MTRSWTYEAILERTKAEILEDIADGTVPATVRTFGELHDYVDANCYGGICDDDSPDCEVLFDTVRRVQDAAHQWLASGRKEIPVTKAERYLHEVVELTRDCELGKQGERALVVALSSTMVGGQMVTRYMTLLFFDRALTERVVNTGADYRFLREVQAARF